MEELFSVNRQYSGLVDGMAMVYLGGGCSTAVILQLFLKRNGKHALLSLPTSTIPEPPDVNQTC